MSELELFDPEAVARMIGTSLSASALTEEGITLLESDNPRSAILREILSRSLGSKRRLMTGSEECLVRLGRLEATAPHFRQALGIIKRAVVLSWRSKVGLRVPPILLVGEPGIGKTYVARRIAEALGVPIAEYSFATSDDAGAISGHSLSWKGARPGLVANLLLGSEVANPIVFLDEIDKAVSTRGENPTDCLHALLELDENARRFVDQYLEFPIRADYVVWIVTANSSETLRPSLRDRLIVIHIDQPAMDERLRVAQSIVDAELAPYRRVVRRYEESVIRALAELPPRQAKRIVGLAIGIAAAAGRSSLQSADIDAGAKLVVESSGRRAIGFHNGFRNTRS